MKVIGGFTLTELIVVILIIGILAAVAAPKLLNASGTCTDHGLKQTLTIIRDAIDLYSASNGGLLPGLDGKQATFKSDLGPYIRGSFPAAPVGPAEGLQRVAMLRKGTPLTGVVATKKPWKYDYTTGEFILNFNGISFDGVTCYDEF